MEAVDREPEPGRLGPPQQYYGSLAAECPVPMPILDWGSVAPDFL